ncbi:hypothetical protein PIROE2DRAFT_56907 [Piromyces sp. E2]|nr:hypothetical protein PIROE2DRAFT_56907 [Piromyces sp. E2]|eukprot:OUM70222.1 hypothetical protein PIROE2DRAFT_56907 [Piromyces sp. E2]
MAEKAIKNISNFKQLSFSQYAKYQLLLSEYIFNININKIEDILCEKAIKLRLDFLNKLIKMINYYTKIGNSPNIIQECIMKVWEYGIPLLQPQYKQYFYPFLKRCYDVLIQINSPLYSLTSVICKELAKYNDEISNITDAKHYIKNAYKYCFDKKKIEESFEYKNIELKLKASSMENTTFSKIEEALAMINQINIKTKNIDELKMSLYKILKILIPKHENHTITSIYPLMDQKFDIDFDLDNDNISQLKFFIEVLKQLMQLCYKIKYWELIYEITSYIICHNYSGFPEHEPYFKVVKCDALIKRLEALSNIKKDILSKNTENKIDSKNIENKNKINTNTIIYLLLNPNIIKTDIEEINMEDEDNVVVKTTKYENKDQKKNQENEKHETKKQENEKQIYYNEICEILNVYGNNISHLYKSNNLEKIYFNENDTFYSTTGSLNLENLEFFFEIISILELAISTNCQWHIYNVTIWFITYIISQTAIDDTFPRRFNYEKWIGYIYRIYKYFGNYNKKNCKLYYHLSIVLFEAIYSRIESIIAENSNDENLNLKKRLKNNESILKILKGKPLLDMQECIHVATEVFKNINLNDDSSSKDCCISIKMSFYEIWGKIQNIEGQTININETNLENTVCTLIESLKIDNINKSNYNKEKANNLLNKLVDSAKKLAFKDDATSIEVWLYIVQSAININNYRVAFLCINNCFNHYTFIYDENINLKDNIKTLYNISKYNKSKENSKTLIERAFRGFPTQFHKEILELRLKYYYNNENGLVSGAIHELDNIKQSDLWFSFSTIESYGNQKCYLALQNSIRLSENPLKKAEKMISYADWMYKNNYSDDEINSILITTSTLIENVFESKETDNDMNEDSIKSCSIKQLELIIKMYCIRILVQNSKKKIINMIRCCGYYIKFIAKKTFNEFLQENLNNNSTSTKKKEKNKKDSNESDENKNGNEISKEKSKDKTKENSKSKENEKDININSKDKDKEKDKTKLHAYLSEKSNLFPSSEKEWLKFLWPSLIVDHIFSYEGESDILCINNLHDSIYLIASCMNIVLESIKIECFSYSLPFLWLSYYLTMYWLSGVDKAKSLCLIYSLYVYFGEKLEFYDIYTENYLRFKEELAKVDLNIFSSNGFKRNTKMLSVYNDIPFDIRAVYLEIANIYILLNKDMWDVRYILKNVIINDKINDKLQSKYYYYTSISQYYISNNYDESILIANKALSLNCSSVEKMKSVILILWCIIRKNKLYKFLEGDTKKELQKYLKNTNKNRSSDQYFNGYLYYYAVLTYIRVVDDIKTDELFNEIFTYIENAESIFQNQEDYASLIKCYITHAYVYLCYIKYNMKKPKESFLKSVDCINKAEDTMNNLLQIYSNTIDETLLNKYLKLKIIETKTKIYRKIYSFVDSVIDSNNIRNDNVINNYLLTADIDKRINSNWKSLKDNVINEIFGYYKLYINQEYKTSVFLYNCSNCFSIYLKAKKTTLPNIHLKKRKSINKELRPPQKRGSIMVSSLNNEFGIGHKNYKSIGELDAINPKFLINIYKDIINYSINEHEYSILRKASEELFYFYCDNNEDVPISKFINLSLFQSCEMQKTMKKLLIEYTPQDSQTIQIIILQHSSSKKKLLSGKFKNIPNKKAPSVNQQEQENNESYSAFTHQTEVNYQYWSKLVENFTYALYNFDNSSYVIDKIIEEIVTKKIAEDDLEKEQKENEIMLAKENQEEINIINEKKSSFVSEKSANSGRRKSILPPLSSIDKKSTLTTLSGIDEVSLPPILSETDEILLNKNNESTPDNTNKNDKKAIINDIIGESFCSSDNNNDNIKDQDNQNKPRSILTFPRLMTNLDISQTEPIHNPDYIVNNQNSLNIDKTIISSENIDDEIYEKMDDNVKAACNNDKEQFLKLYDILYKIFIYLYPTLSEMRNQMNDKNNKASSEQKKKKKKKDKSNDSDVNFDTHTILCCDTSFFNIPIEAYLHYMLDISIVNRDFSTNLLLHRLITQSHQNNTSNELENADVSNENTKGKKDKNKKPKKTNPLENCISQLNNFNYVLNGIPKKTEQLIINIPYFKNLLKKYKITKWNGIASYMTSYIPISLKIQKEYLNLNLNNTRSAVFIDYTNAVDNHKVIDIKLLDKSDEFMLFLSLQGINNICYQPYCSTLSTNDLIIKSILDTSKPIDVFFYNLFVKNQIPRTNFRLYGIPNIINTKNIPETPTS